MSVDAYELAYREAVRALEQQRALLMELRGRASALIATASIAMSLLGPSVFTRSPFGWLAIGCFVLLSVYVVAVLWPTSDWRSGTDPRSALAASTEADAAPSGATMALELVAHLMEDRRTNKAQLDRVAWALRIATCLLIAHLFFAVAALTIDP